MSGPIVVVGGGRMGDAMIAGWVARDVDPRSICVIEPAAAVADALAQRFGITTINDADALATDVRPEVVIFAVKPQAIDDVVPDYARFVDPRTVFLSVAVGKPLAMFESRLVQAAVVRAMPNTPAAVGRGMTVACANDVATAAHRARCTELLSAVGDVAWVEDESLLDAVTAVSGSGPAYVFLLAECLAAAGADAGLPPPLAERLARTTVAGAGELLYRSVESASELRHAVTSPKGTTAAALDVLTRPDGLAELMRVAVAAAAKRSRELAG